MKTRYRRTAASQYLIFGLLIVGIIAMSILGILAMKNIPFNDYFAIPWAAGRAWLLDGINPYDSSVRDLAENLIEESDYLAVIPDQAVLKHSFFNLIFYLPFSLIPYSISRLLWFALMVVSVGMIGYFSLLVSELSLSKIEKIVCVIFPILWLPGAYAILTGNLSIIVIFLLVGSVLLILRGEDVKAGFLLALTIGSFTTTGLVLIMVLVWSISRKRWSIISAFFSGVIFLLVLSLILLPTWLMDWLRVMLTTYQGWNWIQTPLMELASYLPGIENVLSIFLHLAFTIYLFSLWITIIGQTGRIITWKVLALLVVAYILHVEASVAHLFLIIPALFLVFRFWFERWGLFGRVFSWITLTIISGLPWFLSRSEISFTEPITLTFLRVALPLFVFAGMIWIRWWATKIPRLLFEQSK